MRCDFCDNHINDGIRNWGNIGKRWIIYFRIVGLTKFPIYHCDKKICKHKAINLCFSSERNRLIDNLLEVGK